MKEVEISSKEKTKLSNANSKEDFESAISEIKTWRNLDHPNIIKYYSSFIEKNTVYIVMELITGMTIKEYIKHLSNKGNISNRSSDTTEKEVIKITLDILSALKYLHNEKEVIYRDMNPNNIMIDADFNVKLIDFGLARDSSSKEQELSMSTAFVGSVMYCSPEVMKDTPYTEKADIWAFGCIIYELLTLTPAFIGDNPLIIAKNVVDAVYIKLDESVNQV